MASRSGRVNLSTAPPQKDDDDDESDDDDKDGGIYGIETAVLLPYHHTAELPPSPSKTRLNRRFGRSGPGPSCCAPNSTIGRLYSRVTDILARFWYTDPALSPLHGPLRFVFYFAMLTILLTKPDGSGSMAFTAGSCKRALRRLVHYDNFGFDMKFEAGLFGHGLRYLDWDPRNMFNCGWLQSCVRWGMALSAIGLGGILPRIVVAVTWWLMFGIKMISFGPQVGHEQYLAGVAFVAFCFAENNFVDEYSIDSYLWRTWTRLRGVPATSANTAQRRRWDGSSPSPGRAARKIVLFQACCVMFFAGVHKFASYSFTWLDGGTILASLHDGNNARIPLLRDFCREHSWFFLPPMAIVSVIGELLSMMGVFSPSYRHYIVGSWIIFHTGIMILMHPNFAMNMVTYIVLVDWRGLFGGTALAKYLPFLSDESGATNSIRRKRCSGRKLRPYRLGAVVNTVLATIMFATSLLRIDYWPFSSYALYNWHPSDPGFNDSKFTPEEAVASAHLCLSQPPIGPTCGNKSGSEHHDSFVHTRTHYMKKVLVTGIHLEDAVGSAEDGQCDPTDLRVYVNWSPHSCRARPQDGEQISPGYIQHIMWTVATEQRSKTRLPPELPRKAWTDYVRRGLNWRVEDAMTASLEDNPKCFDDAQGNANEHNWMADPSQDSFASDMARRLRSGLTNYRYLPGFPQEKAIGVGLFFQFIDGGTGERNEDGQLDGGTPRYCKLGESVMGDLDLPSSHSRSFRDYIANHDRYWTEVIRGVVLVVVMAAIAGIYMSR
mmetsp:Transcript_4649/g.10053  ORF Transcript_4649/g.10053 Transcript_4649/m.10053 type:complete len:774 (-) Transcript_4649:88-2409(-)